MMPTQTSLSAEDNATLEKSWIDSATSAAWGLARVDSASGAALAGKSGPGDYAGISFPVYWPGSPSPKEYFLRRDNPDLELQDGKLKPRRKYLAPPGRSNVLIFGPGESIEALTNTALPLLIVEGLKKAVAGWRLARWQRDTPRFLVVGLTGVWNFMGVTGKAVNAKGARVDVRGTIPGLDSLQWAGRVVSIAYDSDTETNPKVFEARAALARNLKDRGALVALLDLEPLEHLDKTGLDDFIAARGPQSALDWVETAAPEALSQDEVEIVRLGKLSALDYGKARKAAAKSMGINLSLLDRLMHAKRREGEEAVPLILLGTVEPADEPVDGAALAADLVRTLRRFCMMGVEEYDAIALWVLWSYGFALWDIAPILTLLSPEKRCGKTTALSVLHGLLDRALLTSNTSPAAIYRLIEAVSPTLIIDELDTFMSVDEALRGLINSGHTKIAAQVIRCVGEEKEVKAFSTWCPKILAGIGDLPDTVLDRSVVIHMKRKMPGEVVERLRRAGAEGEALREGLSMIAGGCKRWVNDNAERLTGTPAKESGNLSDRAADNWLPLFAVASVLGGDWPARAARAATVLSGEDVLDTETVKVQLLEDLRDISNKMAGTEAIWSQDLCDRLIGLVDRPWPSYRRGQPLTPSQLAGLLRPFGVRTRDMKQGGVNKKSYHFSDLAEPFDRYLSQQTSLQGASLGDSIRYPATSRSSGGDEPLLASATFPRPSATRYLIEATDTAKVAGSALSLKGSALKNTLNPALVAQGSGVADQMPFLPPYKRVLVKGTLDTPTVSAGHIREAGAGQVVVEV